MLDVSYKHLILFFWPWHLCQQSLPTRKEFVEAYVNYVFNTSVQDVFQEFERGLFQVCDRDLVGLFRPEELQEALVGKDVYDWNKLKQVILKSDWISRISSLFERPKSENIPLSTFFFLEHILWMAL